MKVVLLRMGGSECLVVFCTDLIERYFCNVLFLSSDHVVLCCDVFHVLFFRKNNMATPTSYTKV
jgi:hypothetical protein